MKSRYEKCRFNFFFVLSLCDREKHTIANTGARKTFCFRVGFKTMFPNRVFSV